VDIDWPHQVGNDKTQGKWLLYLEDFPIIEGAQGSCSNHSINPLELTKKSSTQKLAALIEEPEPALMRRPANKSITFAAYKQKISSESSSSHEKHASETGALNRVKRDRAMIIRAEKLIDSDGKKTNIVTMVSDWWDFFIVIADVGVISGLQQEDGQVRAHQLQDLQHATKDRGVYSHQVAAVELDAAVGLSAC
jgi:hypothetical protein